MHKLQIVFAVASFLLLGNFARSEEPTPEMKQTIESLQKRTDKFIQSGTPLLAAHKGMLLYLPEKTRRLIFEENKIAADVRNREEVVRKLLASATTQDEPARKSDDAARKQAADLANAKKQAAATHGYLSKAKADFADTIATWTELLTSLEAGENVLAKKKGRFEWAYCSHIDGSGQPMQLQLPDHWDAEAPQPLVISLHGYMADHTQDVIRVKSDVSHFELNVNGRGSPFYRLMGEDDVFEALDFVNAHYPIDQDRVYLYGWSMGGWGCNLMATRHTDRFAGIVSVSGWAFGLPIENMLTMPAQFYHGMADWIIPIGTMQVKMLTLKKAGAQNITLLPYPAPIGHDVVGRVENNKPLEFLFRQRRNLFPEHLRFSTDLTFPGHYYWLNVERLLDAHDNGKADLMARDGRIQGTTSNIERMQISALNKWLTAGRKITLDRQEIAVPAGLDKVTLTRSGATWKVQQEEKKEIAPIYHAGGMFAIGDGQPIKLVAPDNWESIANLKLALDKWRSMGNLFPVHPLYLTNPVVMSPWLPVTSPSDPSLEKADSHLILVGGPEENPVVKRLLPSWPITFDEKTVTVRSLGTFPKDKVAIELNFYNPQNPKLRTIWLYHQSPESFPVRTPIMGPPSLNSLPDICVQNIENRSRPYVVAAASFGNDWVLPEAVKDEPRLPENINISGLLESALARVARDEFKADATFCSNHPREGAIGRMSLSSLRAFVPNGLGPLVRATLTQAQLKELQEALQKQVSPNQDKIVLEFAKPEAANTDTVSIVFGDATVWGLGSAYHYTFPDGTLEYVGNDLHDFLDRICVP